MIRVRLRGKNRVKLRLRADKFRLKIRVEKF